MPSLIPLFDLPQGPADGTGPRILQLYQDLELFSDGDPPANSLFVLGRSLGVVPDQVGLWRDQLLVIDPPPDLETRFRLDGDVAVLYTSEETAAEDVSSGLARVQTMAGGVAHIRIGEQFLDIYSQRAGVVVHLPAIGVLLGGTYGSDVVPPRLAVGSDGEEELDTLRLIARILKGHHFQLYVPRVGAMVQDKLVVMERLAADVAYLHGLRRVVPGLIQRGDSWEMIEAVGESLLPSAMQSPAAKVVHTANLRMLATRT
ncbi:MAG: hypothetical protein U0X20_03665 [Caldilineaceae bacterium]